MLNRDYRYFSVKIWSKVLIIFLIFASLSLRSENLRRVVNLEGTWKFTVGDDTEWAKPEYNDSKWENVYAPRTWESNGFENYNGFGWYRKTFSIYNFDMDNSLFLIMGYIDDVDEVYINGHLIGRSGVFPPLMETAYNLKRKYYIPKDILNVNAENVIAVRVYDEYADGGIIRGPLGIFFDEDNELLSYNLAGYWDFEPKIIDQNLTPVYGLKEGKMVVPAYWDSYGYSHYDGTAVYSKTFMLPHNFNAEDLMLVLGYVDDMEIVYFNDKMIGKTDDLRNSGNRNVHSSNLLSAYKLPEGLFVKGGSNTIIVKVFDTGGLGGIYEGPVGLITSENFKRLKKRQNSRSNSVWDDIYNSIFD